MLHDNRKQPASKQSASKRRHKDLRIETLENRCMLDAGSLLISEFLAGNDNVEADRDGDFSDWIEIHNPTDQTVSLDGWHLTDDETDLTKWAFPSGALASLSLVAGDYLLVFASGKDLTDASSELHTNFQLNKDGEYLALVAADGTTIAHEFAPDPVTGLWPRQFDDISYGITQDVTQFIAEGAEVAYRVPTAADVALNATWMTTEFNDTAWTGGIGSGVRTGVGFNIRPTGFNVTCYKANVQVGSIAAAEDVIANPSRQASVTTEIADVLNYFNTGSEGHYDGNAPFPGISNGGDVNDFVIEATASVIIPSAGMWSLGVNSDDGFLLELTAGANTFSSSYPNPRGPGDTIQAFNIPQAGSYDLRLVFFERGGGAELELFAAKGNYSTFNSGAFRLVGDTAAGGLAVTGFGGAVQTNVEAAMHNRNASIWTRIPFEAPFSEGGGPSSLSSLQLQVMYNDGFVAYLNGQEIARRNAPATPAWNSAAMTTRPYEESTVAEEINVTAHIGALVSGTNVLAIHGLNNSASDDSFLISPRLIGASTQQIHRYFAEPTPRGPNGTSFIDFVADTKFSVDRGFFDDPFQVEITTKTAGATIRYTTDGSAPTQSNGTTYTAPITISRTTALRAAAFMADHQPSDVDTQTYIFLDDVIQQPVTPTGFPSTWGGHTADYQMDPDVVNSPLYSATIKDDLKSIPTMSLVMDLKDIFGSGGIYSNTNASGVTWEKPGSIELIQPDGLVSDLTGEFQVNAGIRIYGGVGRNAQFEKHTFRFLFKNEYGPSKLDFPLFGQDATDRFDTIILRAGFNNSWHRQASGEERQAQFIRDEWVRQTQLDMGQIGLHGTFVHLYINGLYWGLYNPVERANADFGSSYLGGDKEDYDALNSYPRNVVDGDADAWIAAQNIANAGVSTQAGYDALAQYVDIPNLIDYMIVNFYGGNRDWDDHNWYSVRRREDGEGYKFISWDSERTLESITGDNRTGVGQQNKPSLLYSRLRQNAEFRLEFADHVQRHFFNNGALSPEAAAARYQELATLIDRAIVGESARWGDSSRASPYTRDNEWVAERDRLMNQYFPQRTDVVLNQLRAVGLYPNVGVPEFNQHGGNVLWGFGLTMTAEAGGNVNYDESVLLPEFTDASYFVPVDDALGTTWTTTTFADGAWSTGETGIGFENAPADYRTLIKTRVKPAEANTNAKSILLRIPFTVDSLADIDKLTLRMKYDDGFVAYLNGQRIVDRNFSGTPHWNSAASSHSDSLAVQFEDIDISAHIGKLNLGSDNILAIHGMNVSNTSSDMLILPELVAGERIDGPVATNVHYTTDGSDPRLPGGAISPTAIPYDGTTVQLAESGWIRARTFEGGTWSALNEAQFVVGVPAGNGSLVVTEINYHAYDPTDEELASQPSAEPDYVDGDFEFIELQNISDKSIALTGVRFTQGITFDFSGSAVTELAPGQFVVVAANLDAFAARYGSQFAGQQIHIAGQYSSGLSNGGEQLKLVDLQNEPIVDFIYDDKGSWPGRADGKASSLELIDQKPEDWAGDFGDSENWRSSSEYGGSPGAEGSGPLGDVLVNEVLSHTDYPLTDSIELVNTTGADIDLGGWYLSDSSGNYLKYEIAPGTILAAGGYLVLNEKDHFNPNPYAPVPTLPGPNDFALSGADGDDVWLIATDTAGRPVRFVDHVEFDAARNGESFGRWPDAEGKLTPMRLRSLGDPNLGPRVGPIVISEVMYRAPDQPDGADARDFDFIEIHNPTSSSVNLTNWKLDKGIDFAFPAGTLLPGGGTLVVVSFSTDDSARLSAFRSHYEIDASVVILGGYSGQLNDIGEKVQLQRPDTPPSDDPTYFPMLWEDEVIYAAADPWPSEPAGGGDSLHRTRADRWGSDAASWIAAAPTPGSVDMMPGEYVHPGDANFDGTTDVRDFMIWNVHKFTSGTDWATGDFDDNGVTDVRDFMIWNLYKFTSAPAPPPVESSVGAFDGDEFYGNTASATAEADQWTWLAQIAASRDAADQTADRTSAEEAVDRLLATYWP